MEHPYTTITCAHCGETRKVPVYCKDRFCPICSGPRKRRLKARINGLLKACHQIPGARLKFITLTLPTSRNARAGVDKLIASFRKLRSLPRWKQLVHGGAYVIEFTPRPNGYNIHLHIIAHAHFYAQQALSNDWRQVSGAFIVDIRQVQNEDLADYLTKYLAKGSLDSAYSEQISTALRDKRLFQTFGYWSRIKVPVIKIKYACARCGCDVWYPEAYLNRVLCHRH